MLPKLSLIGKDLTEYSLDTVKMFRQDADAAGFGIAVRENAKSPRASCAGPPLNRSRSYCTEVAVAKVLVTGGAGYVGCVLVPNCSPPGTRSSCTT